VRKLGFRAIAYVHRGLYRASGGKFAGRIGRLNVLLLTTTGRKSGRSRTVPLLYTPANGSYAVVASMGGAPRHPDWCLNLRAHPLAMVEIGRDRVEVRAREVEGEEREWLWCAMVDGYPGYDRYQQKTVRRIPVLLLEPDRG
jgi:deazaflavin-dependent oxidoreductase (nitroreductase family)